MENLEAGGVGSSVSASRRCCNAILAWTVSITTRSLWKSSKVFV